MHLGLLMLYECDGDGGDGDGGDGDGRGDDDKSRNMKHIDK